MINIVNQFGSGGRYPLTFKTKKRAIPTVTIDAAGFEHYNVRNASGNGTGNFTVNSYSTDSCGLSMGNMGVNSVSWVTKSADGFVSADCEL